MSWPRPLLVERRTGVFLGQHILQHRVVPLDPGHRLVDELPDGGLPRLRLEMAPARLARYPEDAHRPVLVRILWVSTLALLAYELGVPFLECIGDVLEEDQAQDDVLVLRRIHRAPQRVGHAPQLGLIPGGRCLGGSRTVGSWPSHTSSCHTTILH